jgi:serine/threonine kinase 32
LSFRITEQGKLDPCLTNSPPGSQARKITDDSVKTSPSRNKQQQQQQQQQQGVTDSNSLQRMPTANNTDKSRPGSSHGTSSRTNSNRPPQLPAFKSEYVSSSSQKSTGKRVASPTGGLQVTIDGHGSWSELARQDATLPTDASTVDVGKEGASGGVFGFLNRKKGRGHSPKPRERGVLGKEGARVVIG